MIAIAVLGLLLPGYLVARALRAPYCWAVAFPLSALLLAEVVILFSIIGIPLRFGYVLSALAIICATCAVVSFRREAQSCAPPTMLPNGRAPQLLVVVIAAIVGLVLSGMLVRTSLYPLSGYDTAIRWDLLARCMLEQQGLWYYPPQTAADFAVYPSFADSFPPLVSTVYWWLYAAVGEPWPAITSVPTVLQAVSCFALVFHAASIMFGSTGGLVALAAVSSASVFLNALAIGQETGYTALSYAGQFTFALLAIRQPRTSTIVIAGFFAALGALTREYGPMLSLAGFSVLACQAATRRYLPLFCLTAAVLGGIWFVRNWAISGNPQYPFELGIGLPTNRVFMDLLATYPAVLGFHNHSPTDWFVVAHSLLTGAPLMILVGIPCVFMIGRNGVALGIAAAVMVFFWLWSIPYTSGGLVYSLRVLTPALVALSIAAGAFGRWLSKPGHRGKTVLLRGSALAIAVCGAYAAACCWSHPLPPSALPGAIVKSVGDPLDTRKIDVKIAKALEKSGLPALGVLTDNGYMALALQRYTRFHPVMIWSPEVKFVFDGRLSLPEIRQRLSANHVRLIVESNQSINNNFLDQFPLFHEQQSELQMLLRIPNSRTVLLLNQDNEARPDDDVPPPP